MAVVRSHGPRGAAVQIAEWRLLRRRDDLLQCAGAFSAPDGGVCGSRIRAGGPTSIARRDQRPDHAERSGKSGRNDQHSRRHCDRVEDERRHPRYPRRALRRIGVDGETARGSDGHVGVRARGWQLPRYQVQGSPGTVRARCRSCSVAGIVGAQRCLGDAQSARTGQPGRRPWSRYRAPRPVGGAGSRRYLGCVRLGYFAASAGTRSDSQRPEGRSDRRDRFEVFKQIAAIYLASVTNGPAGVVFGPIIGLLVFVFTTSRFLLLSTAFAATTEESMALAFVPPPEPAVITPRVEINEGPTVKSGIALVGAGAIAGAVLGRWGRR